MIKVRIEEHKLGQWLHRQDITGCISVIDAETKGKEEARTLWRQGAEGVRVTVVMETKVLEHLRK